MISFSDERPAMRCPSCGATHGPTEWWPVVAPDAPPHILASIRDGSIHKWTCEVCSARNAYRSPFVYYDPVGPLVLRVLEFQRDRPEALRARLELPRLLRARLTPAARRATYGRVFDVRDAEQLAETLRFPSGALRSLRSSHKSSRRLELPAADRYALIVQEALTGFLVPLEVVELDQGLLDFIDAQLQVLDEGQYEHTTLVALRALVDETINTWREAAPSTRIASAVRAIASDLEAVIDPHPEWRVFGQSATGILRPDSPSPPQLGPEHSELPPLVGLNLDELGALALAAENRFDALALAALGRRAATGKPSRRRLGFYAACLLRSMQLQDFTRDALAWWPYYAWALDSPQTRRRMTEAERSFHSRVLQTCRVGLFRAGQMDAAYMASELAAWIDPVPVSDEGQPEWSELVRLRFELENSVPEPVPALEMSDGSGWPETAPLHAGRPYELSAPEGERLPDGPLVFRQFRSATSSIAIVVEHLVRDPTVDSLLEAAQRPETRYHDSERAMLAARRMALAGAVHEAALVALYVVSQQQAARHPSSAVIADAAGVFNMAAQASLAIGYRNSSTLMATCAGKLAVLGIELAEHHSAHAISNELVHLTGELAWSLELAGTDDDAVSAYAQAASQMRASRATLNDRQKVRYFQHQHQRVAARLVRVLDDGSGVFAGVPPEVLSEMLAIADEGRNRAFAQGRSLLDVETFVWDALPAGVLVVNYVLVPATSGHPGGWYVFALRRGTSPVFARIDMDSVWQASTDVARFGGEMTWGDGADLPERWARHEAHWHVVTSELGEVLFPEPIASAIHENVANGFRLIICPDEYLFGVPIGAASISSTAGTRVELWSIHPEFGAPLTASSLVSIIRGAPDRPLAADNVLTSADRADRFGGGADITTLAELASSATATAWIHIGQHTMLEGQPSLRFADGVLSPRTIARAPEGSLLRSVEFACLLACRSSDFSSQDQDDRHELEGMFAELLTNGCQLVLGSTWPLALPVAESVAETLIASLKAGAAPLAAWAAACLAARVTTEQRFGRIPFLWAGLALMM